MHTSNARRNNSECTPGLDIQCTNRRGFHCLAQRALDLPQRYRAPASFLSLEFSPYTIVLVVIMYERGEKKGKERKRREEASTIYFTITASSDIRYCRHNTATPIDLDRVPVSFRELIHTHTHTHEYCVPHRRCVHVSQGSNHPRPPVLTSHHGCHHLVRGRAPFRNLPMAKGGLEHCLADLESEILIFEPKAPGKTPFIERQYYSRPSTAGFQ